jgi:hypothetical protein
MNMSIPPCRSVYENLIRNIFSRLSDCRLGALKPLHICLALYGLTGVFADVRYPADAGVFNVQTEYGAVGDGVADDTAALQAAINANAGAQRILYFPEGTYRISAQLTFPQDKFMLTFQGQSEAGTVIQLADATFGFQNVNNPRAMIRTAESPKGWTNDAFMINFQNLTIDTGNNNAGAIGLLYIANNQGAIRNVTIRSGDATKRGIAGIDMSGFSIPGPAFLQHVTIDGFDHGIILDSAQYSMTAEHITLTDQRVAGILNRRNLFNIRGLNFITHHADVSAVHNAAVPATDQQGLVVLLDSTLTNTASGGANVAAIVNHGDVFLRNITTSGYTAALEEHGELLPGDTISEHATGGPISLFPSPALSLNLPIEETPEVPWDDPSTWINVQDFGATPGNGQDDAPAVQAAIDAATATNRTIYFPKSPSNQPYQFGSTIVVRGHAQRIVGNYANMMLLSSFAEQNQPVFRLVDASPAQEAAKDNLVVLEQIWFQWAENVARQTTFFVNERSGRTLIRNSFFSHGRLYDGTAATGTTFIEDTCVSVQPAGDLTQPLPGIIVGPNETFFGRQLNPETRGGHIRNDGGDLWILGFKSEQYDSDFKTAPHIHTRNGGRTEMLGGYMHAMHAGNGGIDADAPPVFIIENASASFTAIENATNDQSYPITIREIRGGVTRDLPMLQSPLNGSAATNNLSFKLPLYVGYAGTGNQAPTLQLISPAGGRALISSPRLSIVAQADDDGIPGPLVLAWSQLSGPEGVVFASPASASTDVTFPGDGDYVLRLNATDGELGRSVDVHVTVDANPPLVPTNGLFLRYDLDQATGSSVIDSSGNNFNGNIIDLGQGEWLPDGGVIGGAYRINSVSQFNWLNGRIRLPDTIPATPAQTFAAWVRQDFDSPRSTMYVGQVNGLAMSFNHDFNFVSVRTYYAEPDSSSLNSRSYTGHVSLPPKGTWLHLAATYDSESGQPPSLYVNGQPVALGNPLGTTGGHPYLAGSSVVRSYIGALSVQPTEGMHDGTMDQVLAYNRALSPAEIATIYASNIGNLGPEVSAGPDLTAETGDTIMLQGWYDDDGFPIPPGEVTLEWSKLNGPAGPDWSSTSVAQPEVTFVNAGTYTFRLAADDGAVISFDTVTVTVTGDNLQLPPEASGVTVSGTPRLGETLSVSYTYFDANGDPEDTEATAIRWLRGNAPDESFTPISGATASTYTPVAADYGKYLRAEVTPFSTVEPFAGDPVLSAPVGPVAPHPGLLPPVTDGLIAFWTFDDRVSPTRDLSANAYDATLHGSTAFSAEGRHASALAPANNAGATASPVAAPTNDFTFTAWVRHNEYTTDINEIILGKGWDTFAFYMATGTQNGQLRIQFRDTTDTQYTHNFNNAHEWIPPGVWVHLAAVREGTDVRLFVNGVQRNANWVSGSTGNPLQTNTTVLGIGYMNHAAHWDGLLDNVGIFSRALSKEEITSVMLFDPAESIEVLSGFSAWQSEHFSDPESPEAAPGFRPAGSRFTNLQIYAYGGDPAEPEAVVGPRVDLDSEFPELRFRRRLDGGGAPRALFTTDLVLEDWSESLDEIDAVPAGDGITEEVRARSPFTLSEAPVQFFAVEVREGDPEE